MIKWKTGKNSLPDTIIQRKYVCDIFEIIFVAELFSHLFFNVIFTLRRFEIIFLQTNNIGAFILNYADNFSNKRSILVPVEALHIIGEQTDGIGLSTCFRAAARMKSE